LGCQIIKKCHNCTIFTKYANLLFWVKPLDFCGKLGLVIVLGIWHSAVSRKEIPMPFIEYYCGVCDELLGEDENGTCEDCTKKINSEIDSALERFHSSSFPNHNESDVIDAVRGKYNHCAREARYCTYGGSCGSLIEDGGDICADHREQIKAREAEESKGRSREDDDWERFKDSL